jgi:hypothetical protein
VNGGFLPLPEACVECLGIGKSQDRNSRSSGHARNQLRLSAPFLKSIDASYHCGVGLILTRVRAM